jgi:hypothetical protein
MSVRLALITLREIMMLEIMNELTDKDGWEVKVSVFCSYFQPLIDADLR